MTELTFGSFERNRYRFARLDVVRLSPETVRREVMENGTGRIVSSKIVEEPSWEDGLECIIMESCDSGHSVLFQDGSTLAWVIESRMTFVRAGTEAEVAQILATREARDRVEGDLEWIVTHWQGLADPPSASLNALAAMIGITNPWGRNGEGATLVEVYAFIRATFDPVLLPGNAAAVTRLAAQVKADPQVQAYIRRYGCDQPCRVC